MSYCTVVLSIVEFVLDAGNVGWCLRMLKIWVVFEDAGNVGWYLRMLENVVGV